MVVKPHRVRFTGTAETGPEFVVCPRCGSLDMSVMEDSRHASFEDFRCWTCDWVVRDGPDDDNFETVTLADLRTYDRRELLTIAAGGGPRNDRERAVCFCPACGCNKSGDLTQPNVKTEACDDPRCPCHIPDL